MSVDWKRCIKLLRRNLRNEGLPDYWHKFSPKTYTTKLPDYLGLKAVPDEGTLCKEEKRLKPFLEAVATLLVLPLLPNSFVAGADMTGLQTKRKSAYYIKRILGVYSRRGFARLEFLVWKRYILGWELRLTRKDEIAMLKSLWKKLKKKKLQKGKNTT